MFGTRIPFKEKQVKIMVVIGCPAYPIRLRGKQAALLGYANWYMKTGKT